MSTLIVGRYRLESRLGSGGMSTVHLAFDERLERLVAVKLLAEHLADDPAFVSRFQREALAAARLIHENIVQVFDSGLDPDTDQHFIIACCAGLDYAHRKGVVHRDVKPGNILRGNDHRVKLADFGIAKATEQSSITQAGSVLGTAAYLAPEQGRGEEAGPPADVYALGVVTYQLLSGRLPFEGKSLTELALKQQGERPPPLDTLVSGVRPELAAAVDVALRLEPHLRFPTALDMGRALEDGARGIRPGAGAAIVPPLPGELVDETDVTVVAERRREAAVVAGGESTRIVPAVRPREPRVGPTRAELERRAAQRPQQRRRPIQADERAPRDNTRLFALLGGIVAAIVIAAVIIISLGGSGGSGSVSIPYQQYSQNAAKAAQQMQTTVEANQQ
jgi:serine/threonine protein kinase